MINDSSSHAISSYSRRTCHIDVVFISLLLGYMAFTLTSNVIMPFSIFHGLRFVPIPNPNVLNAKVTELNTSPNSSFLYPSLSPSISPFMLPSMCPSLTPSLIPSTPPSRYPSTSPSSLSSTPTLPPLLERPITTISDRKVWLIGFGDGPKAYQARLREFGYDAERCGWFFNVTICNDACISSEFKSAHKEIWKIKRGHGLWLWKPKIILDLVQNMGPHDIGIYLDVGCVLNCEGYGRFNEYIDMVENYNDGVPILAMQIDHSEKNYAKVSLRQHLNLSDDFWNSGQIETGIIIMRKSEQVLNFLERWLEVMMFEQGHLLRYENLPGDPPNDPAFRENRPDQAVFSMLLKIYNGLYIRDETWPWPNHTMPIWAARKRAAGNRKKYYLPEMVLDQPMT